MAYQDINDMIGSGDAGTLDPQTQALLDIIYRKPVEPVRPASTTPLTQQTGSEKVQTVSAALADVARLIQNAKRPYGTERPIGFGAELAAQRDAAARDEADAQTRSLQGADQAERGRATYQLNAREQAAREQRALAQADQRRTLDTQDEEAKNLRELKESHAEEVGTYLPEMQDDLLAAKNSKQALTIIGAAAAARRLAEKEERAQAESRADARSRGSEDRAIAREDRKDEAEKGKGLNRVKAAISGTKIEVKNAIRAARASGQPLTEADLNDLHQSYRDQIQTALDAEGLDGERAQAALEYFDQQITAELRKEVGASQQRRADAEDARRARAKPGAPPIPVTPEKRNGTLIGGF